MSPIDIALITTAATSAYVAIAVAVSYLLGRTRFLGEADELILLAFFWPVIVVLAPVYGVMLIMVKMGDLGRKHGAES